MVHRNYLTLNIQKSKFLLFGNNRKLQTCQGIKETDDEELESTSSIKYLSIVIHKSMT